MRKILVLLLCSLMLSGCAGRPAEAAISTDPSQIFTSIAASAETEIHIPTELVQTENAEIIHITVYVPDENAEGFNITIMEGEKLTFLEAMIEAGVLNEAVEINTITREDTHLTIDFNGAFRDLVCTMGTSGERMIIGSVVNSLITNYQVETVSITVDGDTWESGHVIYDFPMGFFE